MDGGQVIDAVLQKHPQTGWAVFPYKPIRAIISFLCRFVFFVGSLGAAILFLYNFPPKGSPDHTQMLVLTLFVGVLAIVAGLMSLAKLKALLHAKKNMVVLSDEALIYSMSGKIRTVPYGMVQDMKLVLATGYQSSRMMPEHFIEFVDGQTNEIVELGRNGEFGNMKELYQILGGKVS
jgi:hypothetical protein